MDACTREDHLCPLESVDYSVWFYQRGRTELNSYRTELIHTLSSAHTRSLTLHSSVQLNYHWTLTRTVHTLGGTVHIGSLILD